MKRIFTKDLMVLWFSLAALICAALNLNTSLNLLAGKEKSNIYAEESDMKREHLFKDLIATGICVIALLCAALNMHVSRNMLGTEDS